MLTGRGCCDSMVLMPAAMPARGRALPFVWWPIEHVSNQPQTIKHSTSSSDVCDKKKRAVAIIFLSLKGFFGWILNANKIRYNLLLFRDWQNSLRHAKQNFVIFLRLVKVEAHLHLVVLLINAFSHLTLKLTNKLFCLFSFFTELQEQH